MDRPLGAAEAPQLLLLSAPFSACRAPPHDSAARESSIAALAASNLYNPIGWLAAGALGFEALAIGVNELVHAQNSDKIKSGI